MDSLPGEDSVQEHKTRISELVRRTGLTPVALRAPSVSPVGFPLRGVDQFLVITTRAFPMVTIGDEATGVGILIVADQP
jgi:hypothetical protein